jgi:hypothetical protein
MPPVRRLDRAKRRFETRAATAVPEYLEGVEENDSWEQNTAAAQANYDAGVQKASQQKRFTKGVRRAGQSKYRDGVRTKGGGRYSEGVAQAGDQWEAGFAPYRDAIERQTLPARGPKGSQANKQRMLANLDNLIQTADRIKGGTTTS